jgi:hypothetical protein
LNFCNGGSRKHLDGKQGDIQKEQFERVVMMLELQVYWPFDWVSQLYQARLEEGDACTLDESNLMEA